MSDDLRHYGIKRRSGRYPWGSGNEPQQRGEELLGTVKRLESSGLSEKEISESIGISTTKIRKLKSIAKDRKRLSDMRMALTLKEKGMSNVAIGERMGINESSVRALLDPTFKERAEKTMLVAEILKTHISEKGPVDIGVGVETRLGISRTKLDNAVEVLTEFEGYNIHTPKVTQQGTGKKTQLLILADGSMDFKDVMATLPNMKLLGDFFEDRGEVHRTLQPIENVARSRVHIRYGEEGGKDRDGVIELRPNVKDLSLGGSRYAQVRIGVDGTHFMKGMAIYSDNIPPGADIVYNTNKPRGTKDEKVFKPMKFDDPENPFGSNIDKQIWYVDKDGRERVSPLNIVNDEGSWMEWSRSISSQVLSKQQPDLAKRQLAEAFNIRKDEYDEIMSLTNPGVKKRLLDSFADDCDSAAVHLKAASLPRQSSHVILPIQSMKEHEVYAPNFRQGENVVLIRHPHGGIFEIPELIVNNKNPEARKILGAAKDAIGINPKVAEQLSGADFDGDSVLVIPNKDGRIKTKPYLDDLKDFNPREKYKEYPGMKLMDGKRKQTEMGNISNLITDMTILGAPLSEIARAVKHSMVVIDAEKHKLDYEQSAIDNGIPALKKKYQGGEDRGAATLISRASSEERVDHRKDRGTTTTTRNTDPITGKKIYQYSGETYIKDRKLVIDKDTGEKKWVETKPKVIKRQTLTTKMAERDNAFDLVSASGGTRMERIYAEHANALKALANDSRRESLNIVSIPYSPTAHKVYTNEVTSLKAKLNLAFRNKPLERQAQIIASTAVNKVKNSRPDLDADDIKKLKNRELTKARIKMGAKPNPVEITDREWEAIQAGAVHKNTLELILQNTNLDAIRQRAMPKQYNSISPSKVTRARLMLKEGRTQAEIADVLGVPIGSLQGILD